MKVTICGSLAFHAQMRRVHAQLSKAGHTVVIPSSEIADEEGRPLPVETYYELKQKVFEHEPWMWHRKSEDMYQYLQKVADADAILVLNYEKEGVANYVGANTVIEMGLAFFLNVPIYLMHDVPSVPWAEEIIGMRPTILHGNLAPLLEDGPSARPVAA